jgi:hypothetical protein
MYLFRGGEILICTNTKAYYSINWITLNISTVIGIDGNPFVPVANANNFTLGKNTSKRQIIKGQEILCWGNYDVGDSTYSNMNLWYTIDKGQTIKSCFKYGTSVPVGKAATIGCKHIHNVDFNPADNTFWAQTGDEPWVTYSHWMKGTYDFPTDVWTWTWIASGVNFKTSNIIFKDGYAYWAWDNTPGGVCKCAYADMADYTKHVKVFETPNDCIGLYMGERGDAVIMQTLYGGSASPRDFYYSPDLIHFYLIRAEIPSSADSPDTIYYGTWKPNAQGKMLSGIFDEDNVVLSTWNKTPNAWLDDIIKRQGFPDALKPL